MTPSNAWGAKPLSSQQTFLLAAVRGGQVHVRRGVRVVPVDGCSDAGIDGVLQRVERSPEAVAVLGVGVVSGQALKPLNSGKR
jgi:hypothetical protein